MNTYVKKEIARLIRQYYTKDKMNDTSYRLLDVGSLDINGTIKSKIPKAWEYVGTDILAGNNVDILMINEFKISFDNNTFNCIVSSSCLEHCTNPFKLVKEMARVLKNGGYIFLVAPFISPEHEVQEDGTELKDCWRFLPNGFDCLFEAAHITKLHTYIYKRKIDRAYCWGIGKKE